MDLDAVSRHLNVGVVADAEVPHWMSFETSRSEHSQRYHPAIEPSAIKDCSIAGSVAVLCPFVALLRHSYAPLMPCFAVSPVRGHAEAESRPGQLRAISVVPPRVFLGRLACMGSKCELIDRHRARYSRDRCRWPRAASIMPAWKKMSVSLVPRASAGTTRPQRRAIHDSDRPPSKHRGIDVAANLQFLARQPYRFRGSMPSIG